MVGPNFQDVSREEVERVKSEFGKFSRFYKGTLDFTGCVSGESGSTIDDHNDQFIFHKTQNNATASTTGDFSFIVDVRGITEYNEDKLAIVITSGDLIEAKLVDRSQAVLPPGESTGPRSVDTEISFPAGSGMKAGDEFQACLLSMGTQYQSVECQYGVINAPEAGPQNIIIPL